MEHLSSRRVLAIILLGIMAALLAFIVPEARLPAVTRTVMLAGAAMSLNLLIGNAGLVSMGHGMFLGFGAYVVAIGNVRLGWSVGWCVAVAITTSIVLAAFSAVVALRARALFFGLLTLAIGQVAFVFVARNYALTGGDDGLIGVTLPAWLDNDFAQHMVAVAVATCVCIVLLVVLASPFGAILRALRDNSERVASLGGNPKLIEFTAFVIAGVLAAVMGVVVAITDQAVEPTLISWTTGATLLVMVALGGRFTFLGPILGVVILETTRTLVQTYSEHSDLVVGLLVMACALAFPEGVGPQLKVAQLSKWLAGPVTAPPRKASVE